MRLAVVNLDLCKPTKCNYECINFCPVNRSGTTAIEALNELKGKPRIYEETCIGCGICVKKCPFEVISIINLPDQYEGEVVHRYGANGFKLFGLPTPKTGKVIGILGRNGSGKTTILKILSGEIMPNFGIVDQNPTIDSVLDNFRGKEIYDYFRKLYNRELKVVHKIQYVDLVGKRLSGNVASLLTKVNESGKLDEIRELLNMNSFWNKEVKTLSGGELQKLLIAATLAREADVYVLDEPSSYLDVRERLNMARAILTLTKNKFVLLVEHDLVVLDYLSDLVHIVYGEPAVYGKVSKPYSSRVGINYLIEGYLPAENVKFRDDKIIFELKELNEENKKGKEKRVEWSSLNVILSGFQLRVEEGYAFSGEIIGILGPNGIGKTTFMRVLVGEVMPSSGYVIVSNLTMAYKPQKITPEFPGTVRELLIASSEDALSNSSWFYVEVIRKFGLHKLLDSEISTLSGGELQKLLIAATLAREADVYVLDEPSSYLDVEDRYTMAKAVKRVTLERGAVTFIVEHDISIHDYIADRLMVFTGQPGINGRASSPLSRKVGMNSFLKEMDITFRRDPDTGRPRVNKPDSYLDREQKRKGEYYFVESKVLE
ncbi:ribosome biogenesis/translation initiation ATPase RLI [Sulfolobales archaeon HS-7]|nr:ribosome biogenesis/translation initiation ATPase RLI [Sulfolobales archaeon HS-7]